MRDNEHRRRWIKAVNRKGENGKNWEPNDNARVCSNHFSDGRPTDQNPDPTMNLGYGPLCKQTKARKPPRPRTPIESPAQKEQKVSEIEGTGSNLVQDVLLDTLVDFVPGPVTPHCFSRLNETCKDTNCAKDKEIEELRQQNKRLKECLQVKNNQAKQLKSKRNEFTWRSLNTDKKIKTFTGIPNKSAFNFLYKKIEKTVPKLTYWHGPSKQKVVSKKTKNRSTPTKIGRNRALSSKDEFILTLMKLRLGSINADLADRFGISATTVSKIINTWVRFLAEEFKFLIHNPPKEIALQHLPKKFKCPRYRNVRHIIDCTEMFIETPKDPKLKAATWCDYKHHQTLKVLVSIMPCGAFNFISEGWGGRASDVAVSRESGFYDLLEYGDEVMADKGFTIAEELLDRRARLHIPSGKRGQEQMTKKEVQKTKEIANLRIFVEQAIRRLKTFTILKNEMPITLLDKFDDIVTICAAICNLYPKLST
jgi:hypothetical protein